MTEGSGPTLLVRLSPPEFMCACRREAKESPGEAWQSHQ